MEEVFEPDSPDTPLAHHHRVAPTSERNSGHGYARDRDVD